MNCMLFFFYLLPSIQQMFKLNYFGYSFSFIVQMQKDMNGSTKPSLRSLFLIPTHVCGKEFIGPSCTSTICTNLFKSTYHKVFILVKFL